ncbi:MAG: DUF5074 domain-containing protein [Bacteroidales bacterium]|nr:DUF5074 domain-containing protein [Bacteroidales bacterium]
MRQMYLIIVTFLCCTLGLYAQNVPFGTKKQGHWPVNSRSVETPLTFKQRPESYKSAPVTESEIALHLVNDLTTELISLEPYFCAEGDNVSDFTFSVVSNSNNSALTPTINGAKMSLQYVAANFTSDPVVLVIKSDKGGVVKQKTFNVTINSDMESVEFWTGNGGNQAMITIKWKDHDKPIFWGYRWDGTSTSEQMLLTLAKDDYRFYLMAITGTQYGTAFGGYGYDYNKTGPLGVNKEDKVAMVNEQGIIVLDQYNFDGWTPIDPTDYWNSGWMNGFWAFYIKASATEEWAFSPVGASGRDLTHGCHDGWNFSKVGDYGSNVGPDESIAVPAKTDKSPVIASAITNQSAISGVPHNITLSNHFNDPDGDNLMYKVVSNSNTELVTTSINSGVLEMSFAEGKSGLADIKIDAVSCGKKASAQFSVDVRADNDPVVKEQINDICLPKNPKSTTISLLNHFKDTDGDDITFEVSGNTNSALATTSVKNSTLTIDYSADMAGETEITVKATANSKEVTDKFKVELRDVNYSNGVFIVNEDWFGHDLGSVNYFTNDNKFIYRAYRQENHDKKFGVTTQFGTIYGGNFYFMSKQQPRMVIADATTLKHKNSYDEFLPGETGMKSDGRAFVGVTPDKGYISTSKGIYLFNIKTETVGAKIENVDGEIGNMLRTTKYVFAVKKDKVYVINPETDAVHSEITGDSYAGLTQTIDGKVWIGAGSKIIKVDPYTLAVEKIDLPSHAKIPAPWYAWTANSLCASNTENAIYWCPPGGMFAGVNKVYKYIPGDANSLNTPLFTLPGNMVLYGAGMRIHPVTNSIYVLGKKDGWSTNSLTNTLYVYSGTDGTIEGEHPLDPYYWFPALPVFPDANAPVVSISDMVFERDDHTARTLNVIDVVSDVDNNKAAILLNVKSVSAPDVVSVTINNGVITVTPDVVKEGIVNVTFEANSNGVLTEKVVKVTVKQDKAPTVKTAINPVNVRESSDDTVIDLTNIFTDADDDDAAITKAVTANSNDKIVNASITGSNLTLDFIDGKSGNANIDITATSNGKTVTTTVAVTVTADQAPVVKKAVDPITVKIGSSDIKVDLSDTFTDTDDDDNAITVAIKKNNNTSLVNAVLNGKMLTISLISSNSGDAVITVTATSRGKTVDTDITVSVGEDQAPTVKTAIDAVTVKEDAADVVIDLTNTFTDADNDDAAITKAVKSNSNKSLVTVTLVDNNLTLSFTKGKSGDATVEITATSNGKSVTTQVSVTVKADQAPVVKKSVSKIVVNQNADNKVIDLSGVFTDADDDNSAITKAVTSNSNEDLVTATVNGDNLTLAFAKDKYGDAAIQITATSNGKTVAVTLNVEVNKVATAINSADELSVNIYPNPVNDRFAVSVPDRENVEISVYTINGKIVYKDLNYNTDSFIDISDLKSGVYFVKIISGKSTTINKIIKQ